SPDVNEVVRARFDGPDEASVEAAIDAAVRLFGDRPFFWWIGPDDEPSDLSARLVARGVVFLDDIPGMAMDLAELADAAEAPPPAELAIRPVLDSTAFDSFHAVITHGFPEDWTNQKTIDQIG